MIVHNIYHVIRVDNAERCQAVTHYCEESDKHIVDNVDSVRIMNAFTSSIYPAWKISKGKKGTQALTDQEEHPDKTKDGDQKCIECDEESKCCCSSDFITNAGTYVTYEF